MIPINRQPTIQFALTEKAKELGIEFCQPRDGDAGYDLYSTEQVLIPAGNYSQPFSVGIHVEIPAGFVGLIKDRSSMAKKGIHVMGGVIDSSYRGEISVILQNVGSVQYVIRRKDKIAQLVIVLALTLPTERVSLEALSQTERGAGGFGSTGG